MGLQQHTTYYHVILNALCIFHKMSCNLDGKDSYSHHHHRVCVYIYIYIINI